MNASRFLAAGAVVVVLAAAAPAQTTVALLPIADNTLYEYALGGFSNGAGPHLYVGRTYAQGGSARRRALLRFDFSALPPGSLVTNVELAFNVSGANGNPTVIALHKATEAWGEGASDAGSPGGAGAPAATGA